MQLPEPPPPPLAPLWDRVLRAQALPPDLDVQLLYVAIRDRLTHSEWEVRLHALRVLADVLPISGNALAFPFDQVIDNLGHGSPNVRKAALDALKVFCSHCEDTECAAQAILDKCSYRNVRPHSDDFDAKTNIITGLILSIPSAVGILKRRSQKLDLFPVFSVLGDKLLDAQHRDVALRSLIKLRRVCGPRDFMMYVANLDQHIQDKFRLLCEVYDEDSLDVYYAPRKVGFYELQSTASSDGKQTEIFNAEVRAPIRISTDSSSDDSFHRLPFSYNSYGKVIIETEIKFDSDTAITMTVLEENETETESERHDRHEGSEDECDSSDHHVLKYSDGDSEDTDVVVKKVRFGGESVKIRTPDSENQCTSEDDHKSPPLEQQDNVEKAGAISTPAILNKNQSIELDNREAKLKKSGIPLPVIQTKLAKPQTSSPPLPKPNQKMKRKSKSLSELYDYFRSKNGYNSNDKSREDTGFALTLRSEVRRSEKVPSPVEPHKEVEVLHNLQRSPTISPRRRKSVVQIEQDGLLVNIVSSSYEAQLLSPRPISPIRGHYDWEDLGILPEHVVEQLHNKENWILTVKAADYLHNALLDEETVRRVEPAAVSLAQHMWALSEAVSAAKAPAEGAVCALFRAASNDCAREMLPSMMSRMTKEPPPSGVPHALLQRLALHHLVDLLFDPSMTDIPGDSEKIQSGQLRAALCLARAAGPAAVLSAVRRRLAGSARADDFCQKLRDLLNRPVNNARQGHLSRISQLPVPVKRRARSTPPPAVPHPPRRLRPLPDSAPLPGVSQSQPIKREDLLAPLPPHTASSKRDSSASTSANDKEKVEDEEKHKEDVVYENDETDFLVEEPPELERAPSRHTNSLHLEDCSLKTQDSNEPLKIEEVTQTRPSSRGGESLFGSRKSLQSESSKTPEHHYLSRKSSPSPARSDKSTPTTPCKSRTTSPVHVYEDRAPTERDVRTALSECIIPAKNEDWEIVVNGLLEIERLAEDPSARAPAASWRAVSRATSGHVRSLRSRVARAACSALGSLFEHRGRALDPELEEATAALLERCADVNKFLRADAAENLARVACGGSSARAVVALSRRGATHRAGPVRAAATQALARLVQHHGATRMLDLHGEPRTLLLRAAGELLADASADTRQHARRLCMALTNDLRFRPLLKESMPPTRYKAIEKYVDKLRIR